MSCKQDHINLTILILPLTQDIKPSDLQPWHKTFCRQRWLFLGKNWRAKIDQFFANTDSLFLSRYKEHEPKILYWYRQLFCQDDQKRKQLFCCASGRWHPLLIPTHDVDTSCLSDMGFLSFQMGTVFNFFETQIASAQRLDLNLQIVAVRGGWRPITELIYFSLDSEEYKYWNLQVYIYHTLTNKYKLPWARTFSFERELLADAEMRC